VDPSANARDVAAVLAGRRITLVLVLDALDGDALRFATTFGDLIPAFDLYADKAGAAHVVTRSVVNTGTWTWPGRAPFIEARAILISGAGGAGDRRADASAVIGYFAGRLALGAEEVPR
jgi:hypothetical protein